MIFSADRNWGIGYKNNLLFRAKADMKRFREMTAGKTVIMGRKTLQSLPGGKILHGRVNLILSRDGSYYAEGARVFGSAGALLEETERLPPDDVFVIGGGEIYRLLMPYCGKAYVTSWDAVFPADSFMVNLDEDSGWVLAHTSEPLSENGVVFKYKLYKRRV